MPTVAEMTGARVAVVPVEVLEEVRVALRRSLRLLEQEFDGFGPMEPETRAINQARATLAKLESLTPHNQGRLFDV